MNYLIFFCLLQFVYSFEPSCTTCKFFIPNSLNPNLGLCRLFQENIYDDNNKEYIVNNVALQCRTNENLCGKNGRLYQPVNTKFKNYEYVRKITNDKYEAEKDFEKIEEIELELLDIFQKMRKHNTKRIYKKTNDLIKLFKNNHKLF
jgi:hypothetical protein